MDGRRVSAHRPRLGVVLGYVAGCTAGGWGLRRLPQAATAAQRGSAGRIGIEGARQDAALGLCAAGVALGLRRERLVLSLTDSAQQHLSSWVYVKGSCLRMPTSGACSDQ